MDEKDPRKGYTRGWKKGRKSSNNMEGGGPLGKKKNYARFKQDAGRGERQKKLRPQKGLVKKGGDKRG